MARMFPSKVPREIREDPMRAGEIKVYDNLKTQLPDDFDIYYSSPWLATRDDGTEVDGECDFLIAHQELGILAIEVKGGRISIDADNRWKTTNRHNFTRYVKNPVAQARSAKHALIEKVRHVRRRWVVARHGVILPHTRRPATERDFRPDAPLKIFAFEEDIEDLQEWVSRRFLDPENEDSLRAKCDGLGIDGMTTLQDILARPIQLHDRLRPYVRQDLDQIEMLTKEQFGIIQSLGSNKRVAIPGAAGTGKTILAMEKAIRIAEEGKRALLLCYNAPLGIHFKKVFEGESNIWAGSFHSFWKQMDDRLTAARGSVPRDLKGLSDEQQADALVEALGEVGEGEFEALIIDEGQDFSSSWLEALELTMREDGDVIYYVFYDDNQRVTPRSGDYIKRLDHVEYRLLRNLRNTKNIFRTMGQFYQGNDVITATGPEGLAVKWTACENLFDAKRHLAQYVGDLVKDQRLLERDIAVLVPKRSDIDEIVSNGRLAGYRTHSADDIDEKKGVVVDSIRRFKGLEMPAVFLIFTNDILGEMELLYTSISRAMAYLHVLGPSSLLEQIKLACTVDEEW